MTRESSFHPSYDLDAMNVVMARVMFLMMNDTNDNYADVVHELFRAYDESLYHNDLSK